MFFAKLQNRSVKSAVLLQLVRALLDSEQESLLKAKPILKSTSCTFTVG